MAIKLKYGSRPVYWDLTKRCVVDRSKLEIYRKGGKLKLPNEVVKFDSTHEFKVYLELIRIYGLERINLHYPIETIPKGQCYPNGKTWKVDFAIKHKDYVDEIVCYVEAKGLLTTEFTYTLATLEQTNYKAFRTLFVVFPSKIPKQNKIVKNLLDSFCSSNILTLSQLKKTNYLL